jgi:hypothetical protein
MNSPDTVFDFRFPDAPVKRGEWASLFFEPVPFSGERYAVAVAGVLEDGSVALRQIVSERMIRCWFKNYAASVSGFVKLACESLGSHLSQKKSLQGWQPLTDGMILGEIRESAADSLQGLLDVASIATSLHPEPTVEIDDEIGPDEVSASFAVDQFAKQIRLAIEKSAPHLKPNFLKTYSLKRGGTENTIDYWGARYGANFGVLQPRRRQYRNSFTLAQGKLWKLLTLRDAKPTTLFTPPVYELVLWHPSANMPDYFPEDIQRTSEGLIELQAEAEKEGVGFLPVTDSSQAAQRIQELENAP